VSKKLKKPKFIDLMVDEKEGSYWLIAKMTFEDTTISTEYYKYPQTFSSQDEAVSFGKSHLRELFDKEMPHIKYSFHDIQ
jgi:hypothetical protein